MNRPDISRLTKNRTIYLQLGIIVALSLTLMAFNYTVYDQPNKDYKTPVTLEQDELVEVVRTVHKKKELPPPTSLKPTEKFIEEVVFTEPLPAPVAPVVIIDPKPGPPVIIPRIAPKPKPPVIIEDSNDGIEDIFEVVEQMPRFAGCEEENIGDKDKKLCADQKLLSYIYSKVKYPGMARENGIEGIVVASFVVEKDGSISGLKISRDIGGGCGKEVLRIVESMPDWIPGEQRGRKVRVQFNLPVRFTLK